MPIHQQLQNLQNLQIPTVSDKPRVCCLQSLRNWLEDRTDVCRACETCKTDWTLMPKRGRKPDDISKDQPRAEPFSEQLLAYQNVMRDALKPELNAEQKRQLNAMVERYAEQGVAADLKNRGLSETVWWWRYVYSTPELGRFQKLTKDGKEMKKRFNLTDEEVATIRLANPHCYQFPAFVYEMAVRMKEPDLIPVPWIKLPTEDRILFIDALLRPNSLTGILMDGPLNEDSLEHWHWTRPVGNLILNLLHSDTTLLETFVATFVSSERRRLKIPPPVPNQNKQNKPFSWNAVEDSDLKHFGKAMLNDSQRSRLAKARNKVSSLLLGIADAKTGGKQKARKIESA